MNDITSGIGNINPGNFHLPELGGLPKVELPEIKMPEFGKIFDDGTNFSDDALDDLAGTATEQPTHGQVPGDKPAAVKMEPKPEPKPRPEPKPEDDLMKKIMEMLKNFDITKIFERLRMD